MVSKEVEMHATICYESPTNSALFMANPSLLAPLNSHLVVFLFTSRRPPISPSPSPSLADTLGPWHRWMNGEAGSFSRHEKFFALRGSQMILVRDSATGQRPHQSLLLPQ